MNAVKQMPLSYFKIRVPHTACLSLLNDLRITFCSWRDLEGPGQCSVPRYGAHVSERFD